MPLAFPAQRCASTCLASLPLYPPSRRASFVARNSPRHCFTSWLYGREERGGERRRQETRDFPVSLCLFRSSGKRATPATRRLLASQLVPERKLRWPWAWAITTMSRCNPWQSRYSTNLPIYSNPENLSYTFGWLYVIFFPIVPELLNRDYRLIELPFLNVNCVTTYLDWRTKEIKGTCHRLVLGLWVEFRWKLGAYSCAWQLYPSHHAVSLAAPRKMRLENSQVFLKFRPSRCRIYFGAGTRKQRLIERADSARLGPPLQVENERNRRKRVETFSPGTFDNKLTT